MVKTMKAAVVREFGKPLTIDEVPVPEPGPGQIQVAIHASGVCHTDLHAAEGDWPVKPTPPFIPGHEGVGLVSGVGAGVKHVREGDRVGVPGSIPPAAIARHCLGGWETLCEAQQNTGYSVNGGFADFVLADPNFVGHLPDNIGFAEIAPDPLRRCHRLQGAEDDRHQARRLGGDLRDRRAGTHGRAICPSHGAERRGGRH